MSSQSRRPVDCSFSTGLCVERLRQRQHRMLQRSTAVREVLTRLLLEGKHAGEITESLNRLLERPVSIP